MREFVLVTGATDGIGKETARMYCERGDRVIVHGKNPAEAMRVQRELEQRTGKRPEVVIADFRSLRQVEGLAAEIHLRFPLLRVLINGAGVFSERRLVTKDGFEQTFQVNYLAAFLLSLRLLDLLKLHSSSRIVNVASGPPLGTVLDFEDLQLEHGYEGHRAFAASKLALLSFTRELSERVLGGGVTVSACHPGGWVTKPDPRVEDPWFRKRLWDLTEELLVRRARMAA